MILYIQIWRQELARETKKAVLQVNSSSESLEIWTPKAMKQRRAPAQSRREKPENSCLQNLIHSGVVGGGVRLFSPYLALPSSACLVVSPVSRLVPNLSHSSETSTMWTSSTSSLLRLSVPPPFFPETLKMQGRTNPQD